MRATTIWRAFKHRWLLILIPVALTVILVGWWYIRHAGYSPTKDQLDRYFNDPASRAAMITDM